MKHIERVTFNNPHASLGLKVFIYPEEGAKKVEDYSRLDPRNLSKYDIILMSFRALQKGFHDSNVDFTSPRILHSTYAIYPPPFLCVNYALMVVDETQNIESASTSQVLSMACKIQSVRRVCVSGTPFGSGRLSDLYSLCQFLRIEPYNSHSRAWQAIIEAPVLHLSTACRLQWLRGMFRSLTLRRTKEMIQTQLELPEHTITTKPLVFSTFEVRLTHFILSNK